MTEAAVELEAALADSISRAREFGDVLVTRVVARWEASFGDRDLSRSYAVTDVFRRAGDDWRLAWRVSVRLPE